MDTNTTPPSDLPEDLQLAIDLIEPDSEDSAFEQWLDSERPHGDAEAVHRQWEESRQLRWLLQANKAAAAISAMHAANVAALARIAELEAERDRLAERERACPTATEAEARALMRALQEVAASVGLGLADSPAQVVAAVAGLKAERDELIAWKAAIEAQEPMTDEQRAWSRLGPLIEKHQIGISTPSNQVHRNGGPNAGWGNSGFWGGTAWMHGLERRPAVSGKSSALEVVTELAATISTAPEAAR